MPPCRRLLSLPPTPGAARRILLPAVFCLLAGARPGPPAAAAQEPFPPLSHQAWSTEEGLPAPAVHQILQSSEGYLWLATEGGAVRFDGVGFSVLGRQQSPAFASDDVRALAESPPGTLWFGTAEGLVRRQGGALRRFTEADGLPSAAILSLAVGEGGRLLALTPAGLAVWDGLRFRPAGEGGQAPVTGLVADGRGSAWALSGPGALRVHSRSHGGAGEAALEPAPLPDPTGEPGRRGELREPLRGLELSADGAFWSFSAHELHVSAPGLHRTLRMGRDLPAGRFTALRADQLGRVWIGTSRGLFLLASAHATPRPVEALGSESILEIEADREGNLWIGTESSGLHALRPRKFASEPGAAGEPVTALALAPGGSVWFGTRDDGVRALAAGRAEAPVDPARLNSRVILSLASGRGADMWVGTPDGLNRVRGGQVRKYSSASGLPDDFVRSLLVDASGAAWMGTRRGLARLEGDGVRTFSRRDGLGSDSIGPLLEAGRGAAAGSPPRDRAPGLWIGTAAGLSRFDGSHFENFPVTAAPGPPSSPPAAGIVTALAEGRGGRLWAGVHGSGLHLLAGGSLRPVPNPGLPSELSALAADALGNLWLRAPRGIYRASEEDLEACALRGTACDRAPLSMTAADGLPGEAPAGEGMPAVLVRGDQLWFATRKGIAIADWRRLPFNATPPPVVLEHFLTDGSERPLTAPAADIEAGHGRYTFVYAALSFTLPAKNRYRYRLEGFDRDWIEAGGARSASYTSLPPGRYRFRVQAANNDGVWNRQGAEVSFRVLPPVYRRWWFFLACLLAAAALIVLALGLRTRVLERRFALLLEERNRMAREIHDTLAQDFVSVSLQLDLALGLLAAGRFEEARQQLRTTRGLASEGLAAARQSIWNLRANLSKQSLPGRIRLLLDRHAVRGGATPRLRVGGPARALPAALEQEVYRIAQESLANVERHSAAAEVAVELEYGHDRLQLEVRDNGRGFHPATARAGAGHYGLQGMEERARAIGGRLAVRSLPGEGTTVTLTVPLPAAGEGEDAKE